MKDRIAAMIHRVIALPILALGWIFQFLSAIVILSVQISLPLVLLGTLLSVLGVDGDTLEFFELGRGTPVDDLDLLVAWLNDVATFIVFQLIVHICVVLAKRIGVSSRYLQPVWLWQPLLAPRSRVDQPVKQKEPYVAELEDEYRPERSRLLAFLRVVTQIPIFVFVWLVESVCTVVLALSYFAILLTGRYPKRLYQVQAAGMRVDMRYKTYIGLLTDRYPPFTLGPHPEYPARIHIQPPAESYNRVSVLLRPVLGMRYFILYKVYMLYFELLSAMAWFAVVFGGTHPRTIFEEQARSERYAVRANAYFNFMSDRLPHYDPIRL